MVLSTTLLRNRTFLSETDKAPLAPLPWGPAECEICTDVVLMHTATFLGVGLRPRVFSVVRGDPGGDCVLLLLGSKWRKEQALPFEQVPEPFLKKLQSGTCFQVHSSPLRQFPFIQNRQGFPLPSPASESELPGGAGLQALSLGLDVREELGLDLAESLDPPSGKGSCE